MSETCHYHPKKEAKEKCESCGKLICLECKQVYHATHATEDSSYSTRHEVCTPCYYDREKGGYNSGPVICFGIIGIIVIIIIWVIFAGFGNPGSPWSDIFSGPLFIFNFAFLAIIVLIGIGMWFYVFKHAPSKQAEIEEKKQEFLRSLE